MSKKDHKVGDEPSEKGAAGPDAEYISGNELIKISEKYLSDGERKKAKDNLFGP